MLFSRTPPYAALALLLACCVITSCAHNAIVGPAVLSPGHENAQFVQVDNKRRPVSPTPLAGQAIQFWFPAVAGHLFGTPNIESSWSATPDDAGAFVFPLDEIAHEMQKMSRAFDASETAVLLEPETTRFARIGSYALREFDGEPLGYTSWIAPKTRAELILVYFDRGCRMLGSVFHGKDEIRVDLRIPAAGLYWLRKHRTFFGTTRLDLSAQPDSLILAVQPDS